MSNISFEIGAKGKPLKRKQKAHTLVEFSDPTEDHPAALDTLSDQQREEEANSLQVISWPYDSCGVAFCIQSLPPLHLHARLSCL
jgi:hypothetical protein